MAALFPLIGCAALFGAIAKSRQETRYVTASLDGRRYLVSAKYKDTKAAANLLASVRRDLETLVTSVKLRHPDDEDISRLARKFDPDAISEGTPGSGYTSYTVDKGARVVLCVRQSNGDFVQKNVIMHVAIHELAHVMCASVGHTDEFWQAFERLLKEARLAGVYSTQDFAASPQPYCGMTISG